MGLLADDKKNEEEATPGQNTSLDAADGEKFNKGYISDPLSQLSPTK